MTPASQQEMLCECEMLADHVARHGELLNTNPELEKRFVELLSRVQKCRQDSGQSDGWAELRQAYAEVTRFTGGVNGHSIRDTDSLGKKVWRRPLARLSLSLFLAALVLQLAISWKNGISDPGSLNHFPWALYFLLSALDSLLLPAIWAGFGASVALMKRISDKVAVFAYEHALLKGAYTRVLLGAALGVIATLIIPGILPSVESGELLEFDEYLRTVVIAFLVGFSYKPFYVALENLAEGLAKSIPRRRRDTPTGRKPEQGREVPGRQE